MSSDFFGDFLTQLPAALILNVCGLGLLFTGLSAYLFYWRPRRRNKPASRQDSPPTTVERQPSPPPRPREFETGDLPDLDMLVVEAEEDAEPETVTPPPAPPPAQAPAPSPVRAAEGTYSVRLHDGGMTDATEVVTVLRDEDDGRLIVQMGETAYRSLTDTPDAKQAFVAIMKELSTVVQKADPRPTGDYRQAVSGDETVTPVEESEVDDAPEATTPEATTPEATFEEEAAPPKPGDLMDRKPPTGEKMPGDLPSYKLDDVPKREKSSGLFGRQKKLEYEEMPELDIAAAIEAYLQHKLSFTQAFSGRSIHVRSRADGLIAIEVDGHHFDSVDEVNDPDVRQFLAETIREWQDRQ